MLKSVCCNRHRTHLFQATYCAEGPNRTIKQIITESPLIGNYKSVQQIVQRNFLLVNETAAHLEPNMDKTFSELLLQYKESSLHVFTPGHKTKHIIDGFLSRGQALMQVQNQKTIESVDISESDEMEKPEFEDLVIELF